MKITFLSLISAILLFSCKSVEIIEPSDDIKPMKLKEVSDNPKYGLQKGFPVMLADRADPYRGTELEISYLKGIAGPNGEEVKYEYVQKCCSYNDGTGFASAGYCDVYLIWYEGSDTVNLILDQFKGGEVLVPKGFTAK